MSDSATGDPWVRRGASGETAKDMSKDILSLNVLVLSTVSASVLVDKRDKFRELFRSDLSLSSTDAGKGGTSVRFWGKGKKC